MLDDVLDDLETIYTDVMDKLEPSNIKEDVTILGVTGTLPDTSDATATAIDIKEGKTAYRRGSKITGTLPEVVSPTSIGSSYDGAFFKPDDAVGANSYGCYTVTDTQGSHPGEQYLVNWVKVTNENDWYIHNQQKVKTGMPFSTVASTIGLSAAVIKNGVTILGITGVYGPGTSYAVPNGMKFVQSTITTFPNDMDLSAIVDAYRLFMSCNRLTTAPSFNASNCTSFKQMYSGCTALVDVPAYTATNVTDFSGMFTGCTHLSETSVNNILATCASAVNYTGTKTLYYLGLRSSYYPTSTIEALSNYSAFTAAGWTIGY